MPMPLRTAPERAARILAAEQIRPLLDHVFEQHAAQLRDRTLMVAMPKKRLNVTKLVKIDCAPPLQLFFGEPAAQQQLTDRMRPRMALLQSLLQVRDHSSGPSNPVIGPSKKSEFKSPIYPTTTLR